MSTSSCLFPWTLKGFHLSLLCNISLEICKLKDLAIDTLCLWQASLLTSLSSAAVMREQPHTVLSRQLCSSNGEQPHTVVNRQLWLCYNKHWLIQGSEELIRGALLGRKACLASQLLLMEHCVKEAEADHSQGGGEDEVTDWCQSGLAFPSTSIYAVFVVVCLFIFAVRVRSTLWAVIGPFISYFKK